MMLPMTTTKEVLTKSIESVYCHFGRQLGGLLRRAFSSFFVLHYFSVQKYATTFTLFKIYNCPYKHSYRSSRLVLMLKVCIDVFSSQQSEWKCAFCVFSSGRLFPFHPTAVKSVMAGQRAKIQRFFVTRKEKTRQRLHKKFCAAGILCVGQILQLFRVSRKGDAQENYPLHREARSSSQFTFHIHCIVALVLVVDSMEKVSKLAAKSKGIVEKCIFIIRFHS